MALFYKIRSNTLLSYSKFVCNSSRFYSSSSEKKGLVLGAYFKKNGNCVKLTTAAEHYNKITEGKLLNSIQLSGNLTQGKSFLYWGLDPEYRAVVVIGLGDEGQGYNELEELDEKKESVRCATHVGFQNLKSVGIHNIVVDDMCDAESAAEGSILSSWVFNQYRAKKKDDLPPPVFNLYPHSQSHAKWCRGVVNANSQNLARTLMETPANLMTPTIFCQTVKHCLEPNGVYVEIRDQCWIESKKMGGLMAVTKGSSEPPKFLEMTYCGKDTKESIVLVGKGVTFDAGGISLKPSLNMDQMRADMGGAACVVGSMYAASTLKLPIKLVGLIPLCENMPSSTAVKPGDVITCMNGKTVCVDNTDAEGRLILADALTYSKEFNPKCILDIATLTGAMTVALGDSSTGVFTNSSALWEKLRCAGSHSGDRVWRFPLWKHFTRLMTDYTEYDVNNVGKGKGGGSCTAAAFLKEFVPEKVPWMHLDIASVMGPTDHTKYLGKGMKGRPVRTLIKFLEQMSN